MRGAADVGWCEIIVGPMFCGKSEELLRRLRRAEIARQSVCLVKPARDTRAGVCVQTHTGDLREAIVVDRATSLLAHVADVDVIAIDEVQFFDHAIVNIIEQLVQAGHRVIVSGLDMDFRAEPWPIVAELLARAEHVDKLAAVCVRCGAPATRSQRLVATDAHVLIGASDSYEARCRGCFVPPTP